MNNYRPISLLPTVSKIFERLMHMQISAYIKEHLSPYLCGFRKGYNTQHALMLLIERWKMALDQQGYAGALMMDLSKAFDTINHDLLIAKLHAYGFCKNSLRLIYDYLQNRWQRTKINTTFSSWTEFFMEYRKDQFLNPLFSTSI